MQAFLSMFFSITTEHFLNKPPSVDNAIFSKELSTMLDEALSFSDTIICTGDLNSDILHPLMVVTCMTWVPS